MQTRFYYLLKIQYLGYRLHGWQKQPNLKTVEGLIKKTLKFVLPDTKFKILGAGRTDAMVSAQDAAFELFVDHCPLEDQEVFLKEFNLNLPPDIRATEITEVDAGFNIIQHAKEKEYIYLFAYGEKSHPFCAPLLSTFLGPLDIELMKVGAKLFEGRHNFRNYCTKPTPQTQVERVLDLCEITENKEISASFFPEETYLLKVRSAGFLRNQIRLMMGTLVQLGRREISLKDIEESLQPENEVLIDFIAPGSGLMVNRIDFN